MSKKLWLAFLEGFSGPGLLLLDQNSAVAKRVEAVIKDYKHRVDIPDLPNHTSDIDAIAKDWRTVGSDMSKALEIHSKHACH